MELLEKLLVDLHASIDSEDLRVDAGNLVANIEAIAFSDMDTTDQEYSTTLLFQSSMPPSMMKFLADSSRTKDKEIVSAKKNALKFLALYCKIHAQHIERFGATVFGELIELFRKETSGEVKSCLLLPAKNILRTFSSPGTRSNLDASSFQLELTFRVMIEELSQSSSKVSKGLRCEGLKTLGLLVVAFPSHESTCSSIGSVLALCEGVMRQNFSSNVKEVDFSAIAGAFSCLDRCLGNFEDRFANSAELWRCLLQAVMATTAADTSRYAACSKAARLISHHAELFQELIGLNAAQSHKLLQQMHRANKKAMGKHSAAAHYAVLRQTSAFIVQKQATSDAADAMQTVQKLYVEYMAVLEHGSANSSNSSGAEALQNQESLIQAVQGLAAIAPAVVTLFAAGTIAGTVTSTVQSVVEAARHYARYSEALALSSSSNSSEGPATSNAVETADVAEGVQAEGGQDETVGESYGELPEKYRKVLFLNAITSFLSAASIHPQRENLSKQLHLAVSTVKFLEEYVVDAVVAFSRFWSKQQALVSQTLCALAHALLRLSALDTAESVVVGGAAALSGFMESLSSAMLLRTLSRRTAGETVNPAQARLSDYTGTADDRLLYSYLELWRELLHPQAPQTKALLLRHFEPSYHDHFALRLYDLLLRQLLRLLDSLDLAYEQTSVAPGLSTHTDRVLMPSNAADQDVLLNLVAFLEALMPQMERVFPGRVAAWFPLLAERVTPLAQRFPLLSALYRLLTCTMRSMDSMDGSTLEATEHDRDLRKVGPLRSLMLGLQHRAASSASEFQAELLDAVLMMVLSAPRSVLALSDVIVSVKMALTSGVQVLLSVNLLIKQLLRDKAALLPFLPELLPLFDKYLSAGFSSSGDDGVEADRMFLKSATATSRLTRAGKQRSDKAGLEGDLAGEEGEGSYAEQVQAAVLQLLGRLGGENQMLLTAPHLTVQDALVWSEQECLVFEIPSSTDAATGSTEGNRSLRVCLDSLLPRIIAICNAGSGSGATVDPQQLSAAAETLHTLVLYMLGSASAVTNSRHRQSKFSSLYERVLPAVLRLAVADFACAALFEKLLFQIVRWFAGYQQVHEKDAQALLDALFSRLGTQSTQAAERDLCARALQESFVWAVRQASKTELSRHPGSVDSIMERVSVLIAHPQETQRTAAVAVLRKIYAALREETSLVRRYVLRVIHLLTKSMRLFESPAIQQDIMELLGRFEEMAVVTVVSKDDAADLLRDVETRGHPLSLRHLVDELFVGALTSDQRLHRRQCMRAFAALAPLLQQQSMRSDNSSAQAVKSAVRSYLQDRAVDSAAGTVAAYVVSVVEPAPSDTSTASLGSKPGSRRLCVWLDAYNWLVKMDFVSAPELFLVAQDAGSSAASKKKRKAGDSDTVHLGQATVFEHVAVALSGSLNAHTLEEECLYRIVLLLGNSFASAAQSSQQAALLRCLEDCKVWGAALHGHIATALLPAEDAPADAAQTLDVAFASRLLFQQVGTALSQDQLGSAGSPGAILGNAVRAYIDTMLDRLSSAQGVGAWQLRRLQGFFGVVRDSNLLAAVFGADYARENRLFVSSLLHAVLSVTESATGAATDPVVFEQAAAAFALATDMGLPFRTAADGAVGLLEFLLMPDCGAVLLEHSRDQVIAVLLDQDATSTALSLYVPANLSAFLQAMGSTGTNNSNNNAVHMLLPLVLSAVVAQQHTAVENKHVLAKCAALTGAVVQSVVAQPQSLDAWPDSVLLLLLEATTGPQPGPEVCAFRELMLRNCTDTFASAGSSAGDRSSLLISRLQWLPYLIEGTVESAPLPYSLVRTGDEAAKTRLGEALDEMCAHCFPLDSRALCSASPEGRSYFKLFRAYLEAFAKTGSVLLLNPLLPSLREGSRHRYFNLVRRAMRAVTSSITADPTDPSSAAEQTQLYLAVRIPASFCAKQLLDEYQDQAVKHTLFQQLMVPTLLRCPAAAVVHIFTANKAYTQSLHPEMQFSFSDAPGADASVVKQLVDTLLKEPHTVLRKSGSDAAAALVYIQSCAYRLLEVLFDRCSLSVLKAEVTQAFVGSDAVTGKELTQAVCRAAHKQLRAPKLSADCVPSALATALYTAAFRCLAVTVAKTQTEEQFFDTFLFKEKPEEDVWERMVGELVQDEEEHIINPNIFRAVSGKFPTVALGRVGGEEDALPAQLQGQYYTTRRRIQQALRSQTATSAAVGGAGYLSQYMADSVTGASTAAQLYQPGRAHASQASQRLPGEGNSGASLSGDNYSVSQYHYSKGGAAAGMHGDSAAYNASQVTGASSYGALQSADVVPGLDDQVIYLELNDLNCAPAMGCLVRTIQRMEVLFRAKWEAAGTTELDLPKWLAEVKAKIADVTMAGQNANVRLFLLRLLLNEPVSSIVSPWMEHLLPGMLTCALHDLCGIDVNTVSIGSYLTRPFAPVVAASGKRPGDCYGYVLRDLVFNICDVWRDTAVPSDYCTQQATLLLTYLLEHAFDADADVLRENLLSIKALLSLWIPAVRTAAPLQLRLHSMVDLLMTAHSSTGGAHAAASSRGSEGVRRRLAGLEIVQHLLLHCKYPVLEAVRSGSCCGSAILVAVVDGIKFPRKEVMESSCELAGVILSAIVEAQNQNRVDALVEECEKFQEKVQAAIEQRLPQKAGLDAVATCLRAVTSRYPAFLGRDLLMRTVYQLPRLSARSKYDYLEMLCRSASVASFVDVSLVNDLLAPHLLPCLADLSTVVFGRGRYAQRLPMIQVNTLLLLRKHVAELSVELVESLLGSSATEGVTLCVATQSVVQVRDAAYELLLALWHLRLSTTTAAAGWANTDQQQSLRARVCQLLLNGLRDRDTAGIGVELPRTVSFLDPVALVDISSVRYDNPKFWLDESMGRVGIRKKIFAFFESSASEHGYGLSGNFVDRLHALTGDLFAPAQQQQWLQYASFLTLAVSRRSSKFADLLFQHSLSDESSFTELPVGMRNQNPNVHAGSALSVMTPLFSLERTSQAIASAMSQPGSVVASLANISATQSYLASQERLGTQSVDVQQRRAGFVRGTQQLSWTQTQDAAPSTGAGAQQRSVGPSSNSAMRRVGAVVDTSSTQFSAIGRAVSASLALSQSSSQHAGGAGVVSPALMGPPVGLPSRYVTTQRVPIRFAQRSDKSAAAEVSEEGGSIVSRAAKYAAVAALQSGKQMAERRKQQERQSGGKGRVVVYRRYREGELPDIAIKLSDVLLPLQSLCLSDDVSAGLVYGALHDALLSDALEAVQAAKVDALGADLCAMMEQLRTAGANNGNLCATLLRRSSFSLKAYLSASRAHAAPAAAPARGRGAKAAISSTVAPQPTAMFSVHLLLPAELLAECAMQSGNFHTGIQVLEEQLLVLQQAPQSVVSAMAAAENAETAASTLQSSGSRKRDLQSTLDVDSDSDAASQVSTASAAKRTRKAPFRSCAAATVSSQLSGSAKPAGRGGRRKASTVSVPMDVPEEDAAPSALTAEAEEDEPTQQAEGLTADELLEQMSEPTAGKGGRVCARAPKAAVKSSSASTTTVLTAEQSLLLQKRRNSIWHHLYRLYDCLGERDVLLGLTAKLGEEAAPESADSPSSDHAWLTKQALDAELSGDYQEAVRIYSSMNEAVDRQLEEGGGAPVVAQTERDLWDERTLRCLKQLCDWQQLYDCVGNVAQLSLEDAGQTGVRNRDLWDIMSGLNGRNPAENRLKEFLLPHYLQSLQHLSCPYTDASEITGPAQERTRFIERVLAHQPNRDLDKGYLYELRKYVEQRFPIEVAVGAASMGDWARTRLFCDQAHTRFISQWSALHPCATQARRQLLTQLQPVIELRDATDCAARGTGGAGPGPEALRLLVRNWGTAVPTINDDVSHWADVACDRRTALQVLTRGRSDDADVSAALMHLAALHVQTAAAAVHQGVLSVVKTQLEINNSIRRSVLGKKAVLTMAEVHVVYQYNSKSIARLLAGGSTDSAAQVQGMLLKTMGLLDKKAELLSGGRLAVSVTDGQQCGGPSSAVDTLALMLLRADWQAKWAACLEDSGGLAQGRDRLVSALQLYEQCSAGTAEALNVSSGSPAQLLALQDKTATSFAQHCDLLLQRLERDDGSDAAALGQALVSVIAVPAGKDSRTAAATLLVRCFVQGLRIGNVHCMQRVLRLVQVIGAYPAETEDILRAQLQNIPAWVFLQFAAQLMGCLDRPEGAVIATILEHTAAAHPNALYYPFRITSEFLGTRGRERSGRISALLRNSAQDAFIEALGGLTHPEHRWNDGMKEIDAVLRNAASATKLDEDTKMRVSAIYIQLRRKTLETEWAAVAGKIGAYNRQWARKARAVADKIAGPAGEKLLSGGKKALDALREAISNADFSEEMQFAGGKVPLSEFSQWLCDFDPLKCSIEVPGQYASIAAAAGPSLYAGPAMHQHETIVGVDPSLLVMTSIRKPKRIRLFGSAGGQYMFLVKGGEDLRNDERIQQLFQLMNTVVRAHAHSGATERAGGGGGGGEGLSARTYAVIPMTSQVGVLEWVSNTTPLKSILQEEMGRDAAYCAANPRAVSNVADSGGNSAREVDLMRLTAYEQRLSWVKSHDCRDYHRMFKTASRAQASEVYGTITAPIPSDFIRRRFLGLALTAEAFLTVRAEFAKSLAVSSLFGYLLGIGDRHLENLLVDLTTGAVIQIDFGICFGMGSSVLQVPELLPFRLTPQLRAVLQPLDGVGLLRHYMVQCLQALRVDAAAAHPGSPASSMTPSASAPPETYSGIIPNALEVYMNDPVVDWLRGAAAHKAGKPSASAPAATASSDASSAQEAIAASLREEWTERREDMQWEPRRRVHIAVQKLRGLDPAQALLLDLQMNAFVQREKSLSALETIVTDSAGASATPQHDARAVLSVGEQVDRLIRLATDPDVLVRQWGGLQTWL